MFFQRTYFQRQPVICVLDLARNKKMDASVKNIITPHLASVPDSSV